MSLHLTASPRLWSHPAAVVVLAWATIPGCSAPKHPTTVTEVTVERGVVDAYSLGESAPPPGPGTLTAVAAPGTPGLGGMAAPGTPEPASPPPEPTFADAATGPAALVVQTAEQMYRESVVVRGSCYTYIAAVYERAGFGSRRAREMIFQGPRRGPYANLDLIQPGDWLYIVAYPDANPPGTHSLLFLGWEDQSAGQARVISYVGGRANRPANRLVRDVSLTYTIQRAREVE